MRLPHKITTIALGILLALVVMQGGQVYAAPPAAKTLTLPDYGGRDTPASALAGDVAASPTNPLAQAWRACEALALVLGGIVTVVYALKRFGIVRDGDTKLNWTRGLPRPAAISSPITVLSSQPLPGGAMLHIISAGGQTFLLAATTQTVSLISELPLTPESAETPDEAAAFSTYLNQAGIALPPESAIAAATDRLKSLLARSQGTGNR